MSDPAKSYDPRRFATTVPYYSRYRLGYPDLLIRRVIERVGLKPGDRVMDLGCGPGLLAVPFARAGIAVVGVDPEPAMLEAAQEAARKTDVMLDLRQGSSFDLPSGIGPFKLVTMGRSFHWMDREATVAILDRLILPGGAIALFHDEHPRTAENCWWKVLQDLGNAYDRETSPHVQAMESPKYRRHDSVLLDTVFGHLETMGVIVRRQITADDIVGLAYSLSTTAPQKLGDRRETFERELRARLAELSPDGIFTEIAEVSALIATRDAPSASLRPAPPP